MYFSCFVDINLSKFQISRKVGKIFCDISKRSDGTVGELVIQNLAPLPLHAMPEWDSELTDIRYVQNGIFHKRTTKGYYTSNDYGKSFKGEIKSINQLDLKAIDHTLLSVYRRNDQNKTIREDSKYFWVTSWRKKINPSANYKTGLHR